MNKKEILEIRKQFSPVNCAITRIATCYVNNEKVMSQGEAKAFLSLPEEEAFKYFELFKKTLSGSLGKNMFNIDYPTVDGGSSEQNFMYNLRKSKLNNEEMLTDFFERIVESYVTLDNYIIVLIHGNYDVPGKTSDQMELFDASEEVYEYLLGCICPVNLSKPGLTYNTKRNDVEDRIRDQLIEVPQDGFLFPAFNNRQSDINSLLYYSKKPAIIQEEFQHMLTGNVRPLSSEEEKSSFSQILNNLNDPQLNTMKELHTYIVEKEAEFPDDKLNAGKDEIGSLLKSSGYEEEQISIFKEQYVQTLGEKQQLSLKSLTNTKTFTIKTADLTLKVDAQRSDLLVPKIIDGTSCLVIPISDNQVMVNGVSTTIIKEK
jgi:hypothetical protein